MFLAGVNIRGRSSVLKVNMGMETADLFGFLTVLGMVAQTLGRHVGIKYGHRCPLLLALLDQVEHVAGVAAEPIQPGDDEFVAGPQER